MGHLIKAIALRPRKPSEGSTSPSKIAQTAPQKENMGNMPHGPARPPTLKHEPARPSKIEDISIGCVPCAIGHFSTTTGLLNEAMRFKKDGIASNAVLDRIATSLEELNALERVDLTPAKIQNIHGWERDIAEETLEQSRSLRHKLESIETIGELEQAAADTERYYKKLNREWYKGRFAHLGEKKV